MRHRLAAGVDICDIVLENIGVVNIRYCRQKLYARSSEGCRNDFARQMVCSWGFPTQVTDGGLGIRKSQKSSDEAVVALYNAIHYGSLVQLDCRSNVPGNGTAGDERGAYCQKQREQMHPWHMTV